MIRIMKEFFLLETRGTAYCFRVTEQGFLQHLYYGRRLDLSGGWEALVPQVRHFPGNGAGLEGVCLEDMALEVSSPGLGDLRESMVTVRGPDGDTLTDFRFEGAEVLEEKPELEGLPSAYDEAGVCRTLRVSLLEKRGGLRLELLYTTFDRCDVITRSARLVNLGEKPVEVLRLLSSQVDFPEQKYLFTSFNGAWAREFEAVRTECGPGTIVGGSRTGCSSNRANPFVMLESRGTDEVHGECYGFHLLYSGDHFECACGNAYGKLRFLHGIQPEGFSWRLEPGESFYAPEAAMTCGWGAAEMSGNLHGFIREHVVRGWWKRRVRPVLVNSWESFYFRFTQKDLLRLARQGKELGAELFVLDDGWFGRRDNDRRSLGDWDITDRRKLPEGLGGLAKRVRALGIGFGLWVEPEMVSEDSELYRAHPDWALRVPGRSPARGRNQLVLDFSRQEVRDHIYAALKRVLSSADVSYVKWDMNRSLTDVASFCLEADRQGELFHRYVLGVYELQERLLADFPGLLLENCCSGGGRFDPGMLYYSPQIWTSDNTDAVDRLRIQEGTALIYPLSSMGAHVAACPSHTNGRVTPFATRGLVSLPGCFGYELDLTKLTEEELAMIPGQLENYRKYGPVFHGGDYYRLASYGENGEYDALMSVSKDKRTAVLDYVHVMSRQRRRSVLLPLRGLDEETLYRSSETGEVRSGAGWMYGGMVMPCMTGDSTGKLIVLEAV